VTVHHLAVAEIVADWIHSGASVAGTFGVAVSMRNLVDVAVPDMATAAVAAAVPDTATAAVAVLAALGYLVDYTANAGTASGIEVYSVVRDGAVAFDTAAIAGMALAVMWFGSPVPAAAAACVGLAVAHIGVDHIEEAGPDCCNCLAVAVVSTAGSLTQAASWVAVGFDDRTEAEQWKLSGSSAPR